MTGDIDLLHSVVACTRGVRIADGHPIPVTAMGDLKIKSEETGRTATFKNVLYVPTLKKTLVSISRINRQSGDPSLVFKKDHCQLRNKNKLSITARWNDSYLYAIQGKFILPGMDDEANTAEAADAMLWHARQGRGSLLCPRYPSEGALCVVLRQLMHNQALCMHYQKTFVISVRVQHNSCIEAQPVRAQRAQNNPCESV
ncbi:hypothetical protein AaE_012352 [Aphanomyces astaci]|uniref:Retrovirus-related Pol polyprotein from transposon TNT 1-94-like beta-barrel domain-containing protein n=1 Tax=Aphanomyces astaci TaxID=112090 RepID=A0A6A4ZID3_APHAT|nr:hypothetical protein AaE_012352 [Aphanomyces astaci]